METAWLGAIQMEIGVLKTNLMLRDLQLEDFQRGAERDAAIIDALKVRAFAAEKANDELKAMIRPTQKKAKAT